ncbi:MAG: 3-hydroxyacyl-CoA dehydrogenase family protein [Candidatus Lokiarchaeota archaeon]|nr:3-hydroxyacyl-CoA dehydrogenase family protein [Candidatus Lokiarchaeota archaeon]
MREITVVGAGDMGHGIAEVSAIAGFRVFLVDINEEILKNAVKNIRKSLKKLARKKKIKKDEVKAIEDRIITRTKIDEALNNSEIVFEAVSENQKLKRKIFSEIEKCIPNDSLIASNTSYFSIAELSEGFNHPERFLGMHFFNPVVLMKSLEIIKGKHTSKKTIEKALSIAEKLNKIGIVVKDSPGFVVNRVQMPTQILLCNAVEKGMITPNQIDAAMKNMGLPMGAFEVMDYSGLDVSLHGLEYMSKKLGPEYGPNQWFVDLVQAGKLGKKTGEGIYDWSSGRANIDLTDSTDKIKPIDLMIVQINEGMKVLEEEIVNSYKDIDLLIKNGTGNPMGIFGLLKSIGKEKIIKRCKEFAQMFGLELFKPTKKLREWTN